jgi:hypothetical protein
MTAFGAAPFALVGAAPARDRVARTSLAARTPNGGLPS